MVAHRLDVRSEERGAPGALRPGRRGRNLARLEERGERNLGVDCDVLAAGQVHDHVGAAGPGIGADARLHVEVDALDEAGGLDHAAQLGLAPHSSGAVGAQGGRQGFGGAAQAFLGFGGVAQLLAEFAVLHAALGLQLGNLLLHLGEAFPHGGEGLQDRAFPLLALRAGGGLCALTLVELARAALRVCELLAEGIRRGLHRREFLPQNGRHGRLGGAQLGQRHLVPRHQKCGVLGRGGARGRSALLHSTPLDEDERAQGAEQRAEGDAEKECEPGIHATTLPAPTDIAGNRAAGRAGSSTRRRSSVRNPRYDSSARPYRSGSFRVVGDTTRCSRLIRSAKEPR